ncbi:hypothetical protein ACWFMI_19870 [Nocardiopsis terrae]
MSDHHSNAQQARERALDFIRNHPDGVSTKEVEDAVNHRSGGLVYQLERLQVQGLIRRDKIGVGGRWFPLAPGEVPPPRPVSGTRSRQIAKILALVDRQGYITHIEAAQELGLLSVSKPARLVKDLAEEGLLVPCDVPAGARGNLAWTRPHLQETPPESTVALTAPVPLRDCAQAPPPHTHPEVLAARRIQAAHAMGKALEAMTDPASGRGLEEVATGLVAALDNPIRAHLAADLEEWANREERGGNPWTAQVMRQISAWITESVTTLSEPG